MADTRCLAAIFHSLAYLVYALPRGLVSPIKHIARRAAHWYERPHANGDKRASNWDGYQCAIYLLDRIRKLCLRRDINNARRVGL
jgi:hypothetical protein